MACNVCNGICDLFVIVLQISVIFFFSAEAEKSF